MPTALEKKELQCKGRLPGSTILCNRVLGQTDGAAIYTTIDLEDGSKFAAEVALSLCSKTITITCLKCGYVINWKKYR